MEKTKQKFATAYAPNDSSKYGQNWDRTKITITKAGQTYNVYDSIQANTEDTEIYAVLEKYNCLDPIIRTDKQIYGDFTNAMDLKNLQDKYIEINKVFESMTPEDRAYFGNDVRNFIESGEEYLLSKLQGEQKYETKNNTQTNETNTKTITEKTEEKK